MPEEFVVPYVDEENPLECNSHLGPSVVGLRVMERFMSKVKPIGFVCINCIAQMWNAPTGVPLEPTAEQRESGSPILEQRKSEIADFEDLEPDTEIEINGERYLIVAKSGEMITVERIRRGLNPQL